MSVSLTILYPDVDIHVDGCADVGKSVSKHYRDLAHLVTVQGDTLVDAIHEINAELADAFCELPYTDDSVSAGVWSMENANVKPCVTVLMKRERITIGERGRPVQAV